MVSIALKKVSQALSKNSEIAVAYLFGSQTRGNTSPISDIDIGIVFKDPSILKDSLQVYNRICEQIEPFIDQRKRFDLVFLQQAPLALQFDAVSSGKVIYEASPKDEVEYREEVTGRFLDFEPLSREVFDDLRKEILRGS